MKKYVEVTNKHKTGACSKYSICDSLHTHERIRGSPEVVQTLRVRNDLLARWFRGCRHFHWGRHGLGGLPGLGAGLDWPGRGRGWHNICREEARDGGQPSNPGSHAPVHQWADARFATRRKNAVGSSNVRAYLAHQGRGCSHHRGPLSRRRRSRT